MKLLEELLAAKNKQASSYPPTALVYTQSLGYLRFAECFQVILSLLLDKNLHTTFGARRLFGASFAVLLSDHYDDVFTQFYQTDIY